MRVRKDYLALSRLLSLSLTNAHTHMHTHTLALSLALPPLLALVYPPSLCFSRSLPLAPSLSLSHSRNFTCTHTCRRARSHTHTHTVFLARWRACALSLSCALSTSLSHTYRQLALFQGRKRRAAWQVWSHMNMLFRSLAFSLALFLSQSLRDCSKR